MIDENKSGNGYSWWIVSLAISVLCCSLFFIFFASYLFSAKEHMMLMSVRLTAVEERVDLMMSDIDALRRRSQVQQIQIIPAPANVVGVEGGGAKPQPAAGQPMLIPLGEGVIAVSPPGTTAPPMGAPVPMPPPAASGTVEPPHGQPQVGGHAPAGEKEKNSPQHGKE